MAVKGLSTTITNYIVFIKRSEVYWTYCRVTDSGRSIVSNTDLVFYICKCL